MPEYQELAPRAALVPFVQCVWTFRAEPDPSPQPIAPDGRPELVVNLGSPYAELQGERRTLQKPSIFAGQLTEPLTLQTEGAVNVVAVRFRPDGARAFAGCDMNETTNLRVPLDALHGPDANMLIGALSDANPAARLGLIQDYVLTRVNGAAVDKEVRAGVNAIATGNPAPPVAVAERQWQRRFRREVGVSARMLASIVRFRSVFDAIERPERPDWVETALAAGYFDQPQLARDFQRFLGVTARAWAAQRGGLALALTSAHGKPTADTR
jgi:AraC-like DNA-binding protein